MPSKDAVLFGAVVVVDQWVRDKFETARLNDWAVIKCVSNVEAPKIKTRTTRSVWRSGSSTTELSPDLFAEVARAFFNVITSVAQYTDGVVLLADDVQTKNSFSLENLVPWFKSVLDKIYCRFVRTPHLIIEDGEVPLNGAMHHVRTRISLEQRPSLRLICRRPVSLLL